MKYDNSPGLAMSRSLGDLVAHSCGVSSEPGKIFFTILSLNFRNHKA